MSKEAEEYLIDNNIDNLVLDLDKKGKFILATDVMQAYHKDQSRKELEEIIKKLQSNVEEEKELYKKSGYISPNLFGVEESVKFLRNHLLSKHN